jgi:glutamate synthase (ferredoxin)
LNFKIKNINRTVGAIISGMLTKKFGEKGIPVDNLKINFDGSAGQSFGAFLSKGIFFNLTGDANDYFGKGLSGGKIIVKPDNLNSDFIPEANIIIGNVALYGATGGEVYINGKAGERFCVRNSAAEAVVEGIGNHGCEYMTGGNVVVLGEVGSNFGAGMSGGIAYIYDPNSTFEQNFNSELSDIDKVLVKSKDEEKLLNLINNHIKYTNSNQANKIIKNWKNEISKFKKVIPRDYAKILKKEEMKRKEKING